MNEIKCKICKKIISAKKIERYRDVMYMTGRCSEEEARNLIPNFCKNCADIKSGKKEERKKIREQTRILNSWEPIGIAINALKEGYNLTDEQADRIALGEDVPIEEIEVIPDEEVIE